MEARYNFGLEIFFTIDMCKNIFNIQQEEKSIYSNWYINLFKLI